MQKVGGRRHTLLTAALNVCMLIVRLIYSLIVFVTVVRSSKPNDTPKGGEINSSACMLYHLPHHPGESDARDSLGKGAAVDSEGDVELAVEKCEAVLVSRCGWGGKVAA